MTPLGRATSVRCSTTARGRRTANAWPTSTSGWRTPRPTGTRDAAARASEEREFLVAELTGAYGLDGRPRRAGDPAERARTTVTSRIRDALGRIETAHPDLGRHLRASVRTGTFCVYAPERPMVWDVAGPTS